MRFHIQPRDVPPATAAKRMGLTVAIFAELLPALQAAGFPGPDPVTGNFDLVAIDHYCDRRHPQFFAAHDDLDQAVTDPDVIVRRIKEMGSTRLIAGRRR